MKKVGIVGARIYTNKLKVKEFVYSLKEKFGDDVEIVSGGQSKGADGYAKKFALEFDMKYLIESLIILTGINKSLNIVII